MKKIVILTVIISILVSCSSNKQIVKNFESETLKIEQLSNDIYRHVSCINTDEYGKVACNGMVYFNKGEAIVFDTPVDDYASKELIDWIEK